MCACFDVDNGGAEMRADHMGIKNKGAKLEYEHYTHIM